MERRKLGRTDIDVSVLCLGTMMFGEQINEADASQQMDIAFGRGINFFDTAELYTVPPKPETQGESERIVGRWIKQRGARDKIILATKVAGRSPMPWIRNGEVTRHTPAQIDAAVERSLRNLQTDYIDLYQLHWPDRPIQLFGAMTEGYRHQEDSGLPFDDILGALQKHVEAGRIRYVGVSNETPWGVMRMLAESDLKKLPRIHSIQNAYNLLNRTFEYGLAEIAMREQVGLLAFSPIAQGALTGKYLGGAKPAGSRGELFGRIERYQTAVAEKMIAAYVDLARKFDCDPAAFALQFVNTRKFLTSNIFGARGEDQLETALSSVDIKWTPEMEKAVNSLHASTPNPCP